MPQNHTDEYEGPRTIREASERYYQRIEVDEGEAGDDFLEARTNSKNDEGAASTCSECGQALPQDE